MNILKKLSFIAIMLAALASLPAAAQKVETDYDHSVNFSQFHTYSWGHVHSSDPFAESRIREDVDHILHARGWQEVPAGGDVTLTAIAVKRNRAEYDTFYAGLGPGWRWHGWGGIATTTIETVPVGTLVVDIYETGAHHLVWRGMTRDTLSDNPDKNAMKLEKAIDKMFKKFPATLSQREGSRCDQQRWKVSTNEYYRNSFLSTCTDVSSMRIQLYSTSNKSDWTRQDADSV